MICLQSTTVIIPSNTVTVETCSSTKNVCATGAGSAIPVVSIMIPSNVLFSYIKSLMIILERSPLTVQQMHPFIVSITC